MAKRSGARGLLALAVLTLTAAGGPARAEPGAAGPDRPPADRALIGMLLPPDAEVWFGGHKVGQSGANCLFVTPPLAPGRDYSYHVRVRWEQGGQVVERAGRVTVRPGTQILLDCTRQPAAKPPPQPAPPPPPAAQAPPQAAPPPPAATAPPQPAPPPPPAAQAGPSVWGGKRTGVSSPRVWGSCWVPPAPTAPARAEEPSAGGGPSPGSRPLVRQ
jgi:uncharacterized protein (TIGR03000 family)